jgi:L-asparaginase / beta-aspartyl-peptidase
MYALLIVFLLGMMVDAASGESTANPASEPRWTIALHGGAGAGARRLDDQERDQMQRALERALKAGQQVLAGGGTALDAVEAAVVVLEDEPQFNAGKGAVFNTAGGHELDATIMDGATLRCGGVASLKFIKNPIKAARLVMNETPHVLLGGERADRFAIEKGCEQVAQEYFYVERRFEELQQALKKRGLPPLDAPAYPVPNTTEAGKQPPPGEARGTVGCVALDVHGNLAAATSTGGRTAKLAGRIGDSAINGAGNYANNNSCAASGTGNGEEFIRHSIAARVGWLMEHSKLPIDEAVNHCLHKVLRPGDGGIIAIDRQGNVAMHSTTIAMPRAVADSSGRWEIAIDVDQ